jgi:hypothetical protein
MRLLLLLLLLAPGPLQARTRHHARPTPTPTPMAAPTSQLEWIEGARAKIAELQKEHDEAIAQANAAFSANQSTQVQLGTLSEQVKQITTERDEWIKYGNKQHDLYTDSQKKVEAQKAALLRRDLIITFLTLAIGIWAFLKWWVHVPFL